MDHLKAEQLTSSKWRILSIPFGGEFKGGKDADLEFFSKRTDVKADWFDRRPAIWHHGQDAVMKDATVGITDDFEEESDGWWSTLWLDRGARYRAEIESMLRAGKAFGSSGAIGHLVRKARDGEILVWPHAEQTLTTAPINHLSRIVPAKAADHFALAGIELDDAAKGLLIDTDSLADLGPDLETAVDLATLRARGLAIAASALAKAKHL